jgi:predicted ester cyclase
MANEITQGNKQTIWTFWNKLTGSTPENVGDLVRQYVHEEVVWNGPHPLNQIRGRDELISRYWQPLLHAFPHLRRRTDILFGGSFDGHDWVCATGYLIGRFMHDWIGIPATGAGTYIRFGEFSSLRDGKIDQTYVILDILDVLRQAGFRLPPNYGGQEWVVPGPITTDGLLLAPQDDAETERSLELVEAMLFKGLRGFAGGDLKVMGMARYWHPDMFWYGPCGIGTTYGLKGFEDSHQAPFLRAFPDRVGGNHKARFAEGMYVASTGWPSLRCTHTGEYLGVPATGNKIGMRVMDWWRREGDLLVENWVFIDMVDLFLQMGVDIFAQLQHQSK